MKNCTLPLLFFLSLFHISESQKLPANRVTEWEQAGIRQISSSLIAPQSPMAPEAVIDFVHDLGGDNTAHADNADKLNQALMELPKPVTLYFQPGTYFFSSTIKIPSGVKIQGTSPFTTLFRFQLKNFRSASNGFHNLFELTGRGKQNDFSSSVVDANEQGADFVVVKHPNYFQPGDEVELDQENDARMFYYQSHNTEWAKRAVGQMLVVRKVERNRVYFDRTLTLDYNPRLDLRLTKVDMVRDITLEAFSVERLDNLPGSNFHFSYAANSTISCIRSHMSTREHVRVNYSRNCEIKGSSFYDAHFHCSGGAGYGVMLSKHPTECKVYNNIFARLRHSMVVKEGANRNVVSYNYSYEPVISDGRIQDGKCFDARVTNFPDISVHGHYSYMNLFEQNIVQAVHSADNWGPSGPGTTFFRNMVVSRYGLKISQASEQQNLIGNVVLYSMEIDTSVTDVYYYKNLEVRGRRAPTRSIALVSSLYLDQKPDFYGSLEWPSVDPDNPESASNAAYHRWSRGKLFDKLCCGDIPGIESKITYQNNIFAFYDQGFLYVQEAKDDIYALRILDTQGNTVSTSDHFDNTQPHRLQNFLSSGMYLLHLKNDSDNYVMKFIVN
ncbi:MAG: glycosyl hydrolase family 28-related protein [Bacteroidota bacterium]